MAIFRRDFLKGKMNKDFDSRLIPKGEYRDAQNIQLVNSEGSEVGAIQKELSNKALTTLNIGANVKTIGSYVDEFDQKIYTLLKSDSGCYVVEYDSVNQITTFVLQDTRIGNANVLQFDENKLATGIELVIDTDNNNRLLIFTDDNTQPKCVNIERAKGYAINGFTEEMILLVKKPPLDAPSITLLKTNSEENNIEEKFLSFSYRYKYLDGEYSALSPFSEIAFLPKTFQFDFMTGINESMVNANNTVYITIDVGGDLVTDVEVCFKESGNDNVYVIEKYNKADKSWLDNTLQVISFSNSKIYRVLPIKELFRLYDNVPRKARDLTIIDNIIVFGNYTENYNLLDVNGNDVNVNLNASIISTPIINETATKSLKSNRNLELGIAYLDDYGRLTTPLVSANNTVYIPNSDSLNQNKIKVKVGHKPPYFAKKYRFFIKQNQGDYDTIVPTLFYEQGAYRWVKLEKADIDKIKEGDTLIIKSDTQGFTSELVYTKVLEITEQQVNFLSNIVIDPAKNGSDITEEKGLYFKIKPLNFRMNRSDFTFYEFDSYDNTSKSYSDPIRSAAAVIEKAVYYGTVGVDDLTSSGTYSGTADVRYRIEIDGATTFRWSKDDGVTWIASTVAITAGTAQTLDNGVQITFATGTGRVTSDYWIVSAKVVLPVTGGSKAYALYKSVDTENIESGSRINIVYDEYGEHTEYINKNFISSRFYENLEEWYWGEGIATNLQPLTAIWFRKGTIGIKSNSKYFTQDANGVMTMIIETIGTQNSNLDGKAKVKSHIDIFQSKDSKIVFETKANDYNSDIFFEIGRTYDIANGYHLGYDTNDISQASGIDAELLLPVFNCFSWGNGFESYKIKDAFNAKTFNVDTRPSIPVDNYRENKRIASFTWSRSYEQSTNYNSLNEFNLSLINYLDLDDSFGSIQRIESFEGDMDVWQEDKVSKAFYRKSLLYNKDGSTNLIKSDNIFDNKSIKAYSGEFGISKNPESLVIFGNYSYWSDSKRGVILRKGQSGIEIISNFGMRDWFRDIFKNNNLRVLGGYDPYKGQYLINFKDIIITLETINVVSVILNNVAVQGLVIQSNYKWFKNGETSILNKNSNTLGAGTLELYDLKTGLEGTTVFPKTDSSVILESVDDLALNNVNHQVKLGYLITNTLYINTDYATIKANATYITPDEQVINNSNISTISFDFARPNNEIYLYLVWDYSFVYYNTLISAIVYKNDCGAGYQANGVLYTVNAGTFSSEISQADADTQAQNYFDSTKQAYANANDTCILISGGTKGLSIISLAPDVNSSGTISFIFGEPNEILTLQFEFSILNVISGSITFTSPIAVGTVYASHPSVTGTVTLDANGFATSQYIITQKSSCKVTITGRSSTQQIPLLRSTTIDNLNSNTY